MTYTFSDLHNQEIILQGSSLANREAYRIYLKLKSNLNNQEENDLESSLHLSREQVEILIASLKDIIKSYDCEYL